MNNILMYCHNGSGNHGCEAIIRSTVGILRRSGPWQYYQITRAPQEDQRYGVDDLVKLLPEFSPVEHRGAGFWKAYLAQKLRKDPKPMDVLSNLPAFRTPQGPTVSLSIGGDNYCYSGYGLYTRYHALSLQQGHKTVLWGCSVEPSALEDEALLADLKSFHKILVRESISYEAMQAKGLTNMVLYPDPAFTLEPCPNPDVLPRSNTVGINCSPMVLQYGSENSNILGNYEALIRHILDTTDMNIALVPHVVWDSNDDRIVLRKLKEAFPDEPRIILVEDMDCTRLKAYISRLRFFVGARTHATIAAYSTGVPTLVAGYSVKSRGIARDIFGTEKHYVVSVKDIQDSRELTDAFCWIQDHEKEIRDHLRSFMPNYMAKAYQAGEEIAALLPVKKLPRTGTPADLCTGCGACAAACPVKCLEMAGDLEGFRYPSVCTDACVNCGKCAVVCPVQKIGAPNPPAACFAVKSKHEEVRERSASGGVFPARAQAILDQNGVVFGAVWAADFSVQHIAVAESKDIPLLQGAKYAQSRTDGSYEQAKAALEADKPVLYSGTPCQIAGLRSYLGKAYENLTCVDIICHGVPSERVWQRYLQELTSGQMPAAVNQRSKGSGWSRYQYSLAVTLPDGGTVVHKNEDDAFLQGMVRDLYLRPSCSDCRFKGTDHPGDITLGDFWGIWNQDPEFDDNRGVSAVIVNSRKGLALLESCQRLIKKPVSLDAIRAENISWARSSYMHKNRAAFFAQLETCEAVSELATKCSAPEVPQKGLIDYLSAVKHQILRK